MSKQHIKVRGERRSPQARRTWGVEVADDKVGARAGRHAAAQFCGPSPDKLREVACCRRPIGAWCVVGRFVGPALDALLAAAELGPNHYTGQPPVQQAAVAVVR